MNILFRHRKSLLGGVILWCFSLSVVHSQEIDNYPAIHLDYIKTVKFHQTGLEITEPVLTLNQPGSLTLSFDDMTAESINYWYVIEQVDANWEPGRLSEFEWLEGFNNNRIEQFNFSMAPRSEYINYRLTIPNEYIRIKKSGNYVLRIYEDGDVLAITRRFVVVENEVIIQPRTTRATDVRKDRTHQEIDFVVDLKKLEIRNPRQEIYATVLQNGNWRRAYQGILPFFIRGNTLDFDYQDEIVFSGGKEWRFFDTRSLIAHSERIADIRVTPYQTEVDLVPDNIRAYGAYLFDRDVNGKFVIQNFDMPQSADVIANYATVSFTLEKRSPFEDADVYLIGAFNDFRCDPAYRMEYIESEQAYKVKTALKQGFYNYKYTLLPQGSDVPTWEDTEGDWYETENDYLILIYYRPLGERYDRILGAFQFKSFEN